MYGNAQLERQGHGHRRARRTRATHLGEVHERARRIAGGLAAAGIGPGDAVAVLAGAPVEIAPTAQGIWMRGASLTMLHQPTPRTDLARWAEETTGVINMIDAKAVVVSEPFMPAAPLLAELGLRVSTIERAARQRPDRPGHHRRRRRGADAVDVGLDRFTEGRPDHPRQHRRQRRGDVRRRELRRRHRRDRQLAAAASTTWG